MTVSGTVWSADATRWYFATNHEKGQVIAYTVDGQKNVLISSGVSNQYYLNWRLSADATLTYLFINNKGGLYRLTSTNAERLAAQSSKAEKLMNPERYWTLESESDAYIILSAWVRMPLADAVVVNLDTGTYDKLTDNIVGSGLITIRLSADGRYVRYLSRNPDQDSKRTKLIERELETGAERVLYTIEDDESPNFSVDRYGEHWLYQHYLGDVVHSTLITSDGKIEQTEQVMNMPNRQDQLVTDDGILSYSVFCKRDCTLTLQPYSGNSTVTLTLPTIGKYDYGISYSHRLDKDSWLVFVGQSPWLLWRDGSALAFHFSLEKQLQPFDQYISQDGRFILGVNENETGWRLWDNRQRKFILQSKPDEVLIKARIFYGESNFVVENGMHFILYRTSDGKVIDLPAAKGHYFEPLIDGRVLYFGTLPDSDSKSPGIYLYNPSDQQFKLLVEDVRPFPVQ
jgi:hypothetical protein